MKFSKAECGDRLSGFLTDTGIIGMIEGNDLDAVDMESPFFGALFDLYCDL